MSDEDYYKILNVSRSASDEDIQKAYRKLARKYHPDLHADKSEKEREHAKQQFQRIQQAYDVLSDPKKRQMYDQMGPGFEQMAGGGGPNPFGGAGGFDFSQLFGGGGAGGFEQIFRQMGGAGGPQAPPQPRAQKPAKGKDLEQEITIPFAVSVLGGKHQVSFQRRSGKVEKIDVTIPIGIESGKKIRLRGQGRQSETGGPPGDLLVIVKVAPHPTFTRNGLNLHVTVPITIGEAVEGSKIDVPTPYGTVALTIPAGTSSGKSLRLKGMGIKGQSRSGDLFVGLQIEVPHEISDQDRESIRQLSPAWSEDPRTDLSW